MLINVEVIDAACWFPLTSIKCPEKTPRSPWIVPCTLAAADKSLEFFTPSDEGDRLSRQPHFTSS